jgi:hypothetical protein
VDSLRILYSYILACALTPTFASNAWMGLGGGGRDVPWWTVAVFEPNGLCRFGVKNTHGVVSRWCHRGEKRRGRGENRGGCGEKVQNGASGENVKTVVKIIYYILHHVRQIKIQVPLLVPDGCNAAAYIADLQQTFLESYQQDLFFQMSV